MLGSLEHVGHVEWSSRPKLEQPILIAAFEGWNDAGDAASAALDHLVRQWGAVTFAEIDPEDFYDFTNVRPHVRISDGEVREVVWPANRFSWAMPVGAPGVVLLRGIEPQLKWRTFCDDILDVANQLQARLVLTLGALLADVAHTRPTPVYGTAYEPSVIEALALEPSRYEGPTGIVGVLHDRCRHHGINSASLWAAVPSYVAAAPSPKASLALVERVGRMLRTPVPADDLRISAEDYETQLNELVSEDDDTLSYVRLLEETHDGDQLAGSNATDFVAEVERFLRDH